MTDTLYAIHLMLPVLDELTTFEWSLYTEECFCKGKIETAYRLVARNRYGSDVSVDETESEDELFIIVAENLKHELEGACEARKGE